MRLFQRLALPPPLVPINQLAGAFDALLSYDWCHDLFTPSEAEQLWQTLEARMGQSGEFPPPTGPYGPQPNDPGWGHLVDNDIGDPTRNGVLFRQIFALAFHGDGVRDEYCQYVVDRCLDGDDSRFIGYWDGKRGGYLDQCNQWGLHSGGIQSGYNPGKVSDGYEGYFSDWGPILTECWCTAMGDDLWTDNQYWRLAAHRYAHRLCDGVTIGTNRLTQAMTCMTGLYRDIDPEMAGLMRWCLDVNGTLGAYSEWDVFLLSDLSVEPIPPWEIERCKLAKWMDGDATCISRASWDQDATYFQAFNRGNDTHRYPPPNGAFTVWRKGVQIVPQGDGRKGSMVSAWCSMPVIWHRGFKIPANIVGDTYWGGEHLTGPHARLPHVNRVSFPYQAASTQQYWGVPPTEDHGTADYHVFTIECSDFLAEVYNENPLRLQSADVAKCKRTFVHLRPDIIVIFDRSDVGPDMDHAWQMRTMNLPVINGNKWMSVDKGQQVCGTVVSPGLSPRIVGGVGKMSEQADGTTFGSLHGVFRDDGSDAGAYGLHAIVVEPETIQRQQTYCVVLEVGDEGFVPAEVSTSSAIGGEKIVTVDGWTVDFTVEDETKVSKQ